MSAYFITATGTGIGKTFTTCALLHANPNAAGYKPLISGYDDSTDTDTAQIIAAMGRGTPDLVSPWRFSAPLSPDMAAMRENRQLTCRELVEWTHKVIDQSRPTLIETVGGLMVPLNSQHTTRDWMKACALPLILVTGSYLGTISHTLTTLEAARSAGLKVHALIINESEQSPVPLEETRASIAAHATDIPLILAQPRVSSWREATVTASLWGMLK